LGNVAINAQRTMQRS